jgi:hypothetical protein
MREDQIKRLDDLAERLVEQVLTDADPSAWTAADKLPGQMTAEERGDAAWCRKVASGTLAIATQALALRDRLNAQHAEWRKEWGDHAPKAEDAIERAERAAEDLIRRVQKGNTEGKAARKHAHG